MKKIILFALPWFFAAFSYKAIAQEDIKAKEKGDKKKQTQEIVIRSNGEKDANITVQINGDKVLINGKPLSEFKDEDISVHNRKMTVRDNANIYMKDGMGVFENFSGGSKVFLGVSTQKTDDGAKVTEVTKESPAEKAGLKKGDIITRFEEKNIDGPQALYDAVNEKKAKDDIKVTYKRDGKEQTVKATLQERKNNGARTYSYTTPDGFQKSFSLPKMDMDVTIPDVKSYPRIQQWHDAPGGGIDYGNYNGIFSPRPKLGLKIQDTDDNSGVKVLEVDNDSPSAKSGIKKDDVIVEIGGAKVSNTDEAREQLRANNEKAAYSLKAKRGGSVQNFEVKIPKKLKTANL